MSKFKAVPKSETKAKIVGEKSDPALDIVFSRIDHKNLNLRDFKKKLIKLEDGGVNIQDLIDNEYRTIQLNKKDRVNKLFGLNKESLKYLELGKLFYGQDYSFVIRESLELMASAICQQISDHLEN